MTPIEYSQLISVFLGALSAGCFAVGALFCGGVR